jgi:hypothetical protein
MTTINAEGSFHMPMRSIHGAALVFAATLAATVGSPGPAEAFFFLPMFQQSQQPSFESRSGRSPSDNTRWKRDRGTDDGAEPAKPSGGTRAKRDDEKSSSGSSGKSGKSQAKSESSSSQASRTRSVRQEPPPSKSSGRANASVRRESPAGGGSTPSAAPPAQPSDPSANAAAQAPSFARAGSTLGDTFDEKLGEVFKARIDELVKQSN